MVWMAAAAETVTRYVVLSSLCLFFAFPARDKSFYRVDSLRGTRVPPICPCFRHLSAAAALFRPGLGPVVQ